MHVGLVRVCGEMGEVGYVCGGVCRREVGGCGGGVNYAYYVGVCVERWGGGTAAARAGYWGGEGSIMKFVLGEWW